VSRSAKKTDRSKKNIRATNDAKRFSAESVAVVVVCLVALALYLSLARAPFLSWDDDRNVSANPYYLHLGWWRLWETPYFGMYVPVISSVWAWLLRVGDGDAWVFRVFNAVLHATNAVLVWRLIAALSRRVMPDDDTPRRAAAVAAAVAVFALHPLQSAAVAWISGGRDLLATMFAFASVIVLLRESRWSFLIATLLFIAGMLSKPSIAGVPLAVVAFVAVFERPRLRSALTGMSVWAAIVLVISVGTSLLQTDMASVHVAVLERPLVALDAAGFYLLKVLLPQSLSVDYGRTPDWLWRHAASAIPTAAAVLTAVGLAWWKGRNNKAYGVAALWLLLLAPVLGFVPFAFQRISTVADHYVYFPMIAVSLAVFVIVNDRIASQRVAWALFGVIVLACTAVTVSRLDVWRSDEALFSDALEKNPDSFSALNNLAKVACANGQFDRGVELADRALSIQPADTPVLVNRAYCLYHGGALDQVIAMRGVFADPMVQGNLDRNLEAAGAFANLVAGALFQRGQIDRGWKLLCQALAVNPLDENLRQNAIDVSRMLIQGGQAPQCETRQPWGEFAN